MTQTPFQLPPGMTNDDTTFASPGRWGNGSNVRFYEDNWQTKGGWERLTLSTLKGVCRSVLGWADTTNVQDIAFGEHNALEVWNSGLLYDITPALKYAATTLPGTNPLAVTSGSPAVVVTQPGHNNKVGDSVTISGATAVGGITPNGTFVVTAVTPTTWTYNFSANATSTAAGGGAAVVVQNNTPWTAGQIDGTGGAGYGTGAYGVGTYGTPSTADYFPLTWSLANWGGDLMANPRGQPIYQWTQNPANRAFPLAGAPIQVTYMLVAPQRQVMAFGCNDEVSGVFNPLNIRWSDIENPTVWTSLSSNNAGGYLLELGGRIVCARVVGDYIFVFTAASVFLGTFVGALGQTWKFQKIGDHCGSISPGAPIVTSQNVTWIAPDHTFWNCSLGGAPTVTDCPIRTMFADHVTLGQPDKIIGASISTFGELTWWWPDDRDGFENSRSLTLSPNGWSRDLLARTAFVDSGPHTYPIGVSPTGQAYWHEKGNTADGGVLTGYIESADFYLDEAEGGMAVNYLWPDLKGQLGNITMTLYTREYPQATQRKHGPWTLAPAQNKRSLRVNGRIVRVRFDWSSAPAYVRGGKMEFDVAAIGGR